MKKCVLGLIHNMDKRHKISELCGSLGFEYVAVNAGDLNVRLCDILKSHGILIVPVINKGNGSRPPVLYNPPELLIFCNLTDGDVDDFLSGFKSASIETVALKGMITPFNTGWTPYEFILEYEKEKRELEAR